jgi:hypothetical protein
MARYDWPGERDPQRRDRARQRGDALDAFFGDLPARIIAEASGIRANLLAAIDALLANVNLWTPAGPTVMLEGQAGSKPRMAGRVRDLKVSPDGQRLYAAAANGGVWYSSDAGNTWSPVGAAGSTPQGEQAAPGPSSLVTSCLLVHFGAAADGSDDVVYAGTGEIKPYGRGYPGNKAAGIGVLKLVRSIPDVLDDPFINPWKREARNLEGAGIFRLARDPNIADPSGADTLIAATSIGLFKREGAFVENAPWVRITSGPFDFEADDDDKWCADVEWAPAKNGVPSRLWVAMVDDTAFSDTGVWVSQAGVDGPYTSVGLSDAVRNGRLGISVHEDDPSIVYVLGAGPRLWRIDGTTARRVRGIPRHLFGKDHDQSSYDLAVAAHPLAPLEVTVGGSTLKADDQWSASLFRLTVSGTAAADDFSVNFDATKQDDPATDTNTFIGNGVHADVHAIRYGDVGGRVHMWVGCDGGVFRSLNDGRAYTFVARNTGLAVIEAGYVAGHPSNDGHFILGTQDNGAQVMIGDTISNIWIYGDGGGVAYHPQQPAYTVGQYTRGKWYVNRGRWTKPVWRSGGDEETQKTENNRASFYSDLSVIPGPSAATARVALGTDRVWISENWNPRTAVQSWGTVPDGSDPRGTNAAGTVRNNTGQDRFKGSVGQVRVVHWAGPTAPAPRPHDRIIALCRRAVLAFTRNPADGKWRRDVISRYNEKCGDDEIDNDEISQPTSSVLPPRGAWSDLAIHDPNRGTHGSFYVATTGYASFDDDTLVDADRMDTLWWFDGTNTWHPTGLRASANATRAPAYAVLTDPDDVGVVYVGTSAGVWKGTFSFSNGNPEWQWAIFSNGLPDAAVQDLALFHNSARNLKMIRAALQARGVWEVEIGASPSPAGRTYLRANPFDTRRRFPALMEDPTSTATPPRTFPFNDSPDISLRPTPGAGTVPAAPASVVASPWTKAAHGGAYELWVFQTALHAMDPLVKPNGKWTELFDKRVKARRDDDAIAPMGVSQIDDDLWDHVVTAANLFAKPWDGDEPTEADLYELVEYNRRWIAPRSVIEVERRPYTVEVLIHHRHIRPLAPADAQVLLLRRPITVAESHGAAVAISAAWKNAVVSRLTGATPALGDGWQVVGLANPTSAVTARMPRPVIFTTDFSSAAASSRWMLLAVVSSSSDAVTTAKLSGANLQDLVLNSHQVAARFVVAST